MGKRGVPNSAGCGDDDPYIRILGAIGNACMPAGIAGYLIQSTLLCALRADVSFEGERDGLPSPLWGRDAGGG
jgi:hypothetical protein